MKKALCIGISDYKLPVTALPGVANDVKSISTILEGPSGSFSDGMVRLLDSDATSKNIDNELERLFDCSADDDVFLYLAGHGAVFEGQAYFVPYGCQFDEIKNLGISLSTLREQFTDCKSDRALAFLDCCHSGGVIPRSSAASTDISEVVKRDLSIVTGTGKMIYAACTKSQLAYEDSNGGRFTSAMIEGLQGAAANATGVVTANAMFDHIATKLESIKDVTQQPVQYGQMTGRMVLVHDQQPVAATAVGITSKTTSNNASDNNAYVSDSGSLILLGDIFLSSEKVVYSGDQIEIDVRSNDTNLDATLSDLQKPNLHSSSSLCFAHRNFGGDVSVDNIENETTGSTSQWKLKLRKVDNQRGLFSETAYSINDKHFSPSDIARLVAKKILLKEKLAVERDVSSMSPFGDDEALAISGAQYPHEFIKCSPLLTTSKESTLSIEEILHRVRLHSVYSLMRAGVVDQISSLRYQTLDDDSLSVNFSGRRPRAFSNVEPETIELNEAFSIG